MATPTASIMTLVSKAEIARALEAIGDGLEDELRAGFIAYTAGEVKVPDPAQLQFDSLPGCQGDACIKAGYVRGSGTWVVKVASSFYNNELRLGLSNSQGVMLVFKEATGELETVLADGGLLTDTRTALAAVLCVAEFGPSHAGTPLTVAIYGTGTIARLVAKLLIERRVVPCGSRLCVISRTASTADAFWELVRTDGGWQRAEPADETREAVERSADVIITATPAEVSAPILHACKPGALVVALGADMAHKREVADALWRHAQADGRALSVLCDSVKQCMEAGELGHAVRSGCVDRRLAHELGEALRPDRYALRPRAGTRTDAAAAEAGAEATTTTTTVLCDLTGVAVQDVVIAGWCLRAVIALRAASAPPAPPAATPDDPASRARLVAELREAAKSAASRARKRELEEGSSEIGAEVDGPPRPEPPRPRVGYFGAAASKPRAAADVGASGPGHHRASRSKATRAPHGGADSEAGPSDTEPRAAKPRRAPADARGPWSVERLESCLHRRVNVYWEAESRWFAGTIDKLGKDPATGLTDSLHVQYDDSDSKWYANSDGPAQSVIKAKQPCEYNWHECFIEWIDGAGADDDA